MPKFYYKPVRPEEFLARIENRTITLEAFFCFNELEVSARLVNPIISLGYALLYGDDSDTRARIYLNGKKVALIRNTRDGQDFITLLDPASEVKIRKLLTEYETEYGYGETSVVCNYEKTEVPITA